MADIKYGSSKADYQDALAQMRAQEAQIAREEKAQRKLGEAEAESAKAGGQNLGVRKGVTAVITDQAAAIEASAAALQRETGLLAANTVAWERAATARAAALGATRPLVTPPTVAVPTAVAEPPVAVAGAGLGQERLLAAERLRDAQARYNRQEAATQRALPGNTASVERLALRERELEEAKEAHHAAVASELARAKPAPAPHVVVAPAVEGTHGATTVGYSDALAQFEAQNARAQTEGAAARVAATDAAAAAATQVSARRSEPGLFESLRARQQAQQQITEAALERPREPLLLGSGTTFVAPSRGQAIATTAERAPTPKYDLGVGALGPERATEDQLKLIRASEEAKASVAGLGQEIARGNANWRLYTAETAAASQALTRHGALSSEFIQSLARGEVTLQEFGTALTSTIGKFAGWAVAGGLVYGAFEALKQVVRGATETATGVAQLERAQIPDFNRADAAEGFRRAGARLNVPINEVAEAQFYAARAGFNKNQAESLNAGETTILAQKLDLVPIQEAARGLGAVRQAFGLNATQIRQVFNELDVGQLKFNARLQQTLPYLGRSASAFAQAGGSIQQLVRQIVEVTGAVPGGGGGGGSGSAATFFTREPGNLRKPSSEDILRLYGFDPRQPIGDLNEAIQQAVKRGRAPAGQPLEAVTPGQATPLTPAQQGAFRLAEALSGGPALAGRYGIQLVNQAATGRAEAITRELAKAGGAADEDLKAKLGQFDEQLKAVGHSFERVGSEIGESGITAVGEDFLSIFKKIGEATALVVQPLAQVGQIFSSLPAYLQDIVVAGGALAVTSKLGGFGLLASGGDKEYVNAARRTTSEAAARQSSIVERRTGELYAGGEREQDIIAEKRRFTAAHGREIETLPYDDKRREKLQAQQAEIDERLANQRTANVRTNERLVTSREQMLKLELDQQVIDNARIQVGQKAAILRDRGFVVAPRGTATNESLIGPRGEFLGSAHEARRDTGLLGPKGEPLVVPVSSAGGKLAEGMDRTAIGVSESGAVLANSVQNTAREATAAGASLGEALTLAARQVSRGAATIADANEAMYAALLSGGGLIGSLKAGGGAVKTGVGEIVGGGALGLGAIGSRISQNALKGVMYAFIGAAVAELAGEAVGGITGSKRAGSATGGILSDVALGAGAGALTGNPYGIAAGATIGLVGGILDQTGVFGGGSRDEKVRTDRLKLERQKLDAGQSQRDATIAGTQLEIGREIEASIKDESEAAQKAKEKTSQQIKSFAAQIKVFGPQSEEGKEAATNLSETVAQLYEAQFKTGIKGIAKASEQFEQGLALLQKSVQEDLSAELPYASKPQQAASIIDTGLDRFRQQRQTVKEEFTSARGAAEAADTKRVELEDKANAESRSLYKTEKGRGLSGDLLQSTVKQGVEGSAVGQQLDAATKDAESKARERDKQQAALARADALFASAEKAALLPPAKEAFTLSLKTATTTDQRQGALKQYNEVLDKIYGNARAEVKQPEEEAAKLREKKRNLEGQLAFAEAERSPAASRIRAAIQGVDTQLQSVITAIQAFHSLLPGLNARFRQLEKESSAFEAFDSAVKGADALSKLGRLGAGGEKGAERGVESKSLKELEDAYKAIPPQFRGSTEGRERHAKVLEARGQYAAKGLEDLEAENKLRLSEVPKNQPTQRRGVEAANAESVARYLKQHKGSGAFDFKKYADAQATINDARQAIGEGQESEVKEMATLEGEITQARDQGNARAQAGDAIATAQRLLGLAKNQKERLQAQLALIQATNQLQQAQEQHIADVGSLRESTELNPAEKDKTHIDTLRKQLAAAKGPDEKVKYQTQINEAVVKQAQDNASEKDSQINFELHIHKITNEQAIRELQGLLKRRDLSRATRRQYEQEIYDLQTQTGTDFAVGRIARFPTLFDAATLTKDNPLHKAIQDLPKVISEHGQPTTGSGPRAHIALENIHSPPQLHQTNHINVNVAGGDPRKIVAELERAFRVTTRSQLRSARLVG